MNDQPRRWRAQVWACCHRSSGRFPILTPHLSIPITTGLAAFILLLGIATARAQDEHKKKVPLVDKITTTNGQEAFSGSVQSLDWKTSLLEVHSTLDDTDEYFPVKKTVHVANAAGQRMTLESLKRGSSVLVYYEQKGDHRSVKEIVVLGAPGQAPKEKSAPPS